MAQLNKLKRKNKRLLLILLLGSSLMFGFGFLLVPLYDVMCNVLGLNGRADLVASAQNDQGVDLSRRIKVQLIAAKNATLPIEFYPTYTKGDKKLNASEQSSIEVAIHPGQNKRVAFYVKNDTLKPMVIQAIPSVSPGVVASYLRKTECFCFKNQHLAPGQAMLMPVIFHLDPELPRSIQAVSILYTAFDVTNKATNTNKNQGKIS